MLKRKIEQSQTSPRELHYVAKGNITPDVDFKTEMHSIKRGRAKIHRRSFIIAMLNATTISCEEGNLINIGQRETLIGFSITPHAQLNSSLCSTCQYTHFSSCHPPGVRKRFSKGEALRLLGTNSAAKSFIENITQFKTRLRVHINIRDYPNSLVERKTSEVKFSERKSGLQQRETMRKKFCLS